MPLYCMSAFEQTQPIKKANITSIPFSALSEYIYHTNIVHFPNIVIIYRVKRRIRAPMIATIATHIHTLLFPSTAS